MYFKRYYSFLGLGNTRRKTGLSEQALATKAAISRTALRAAESSAITVSLETLVAATGALERAVIVLTVPEEGAAADFSTIAVGMKVLRDGEASWKIHFMELVDEFRRTSDPRLLLLPPPREFPRKLTALLASITHALALEAGMDVPDWAEKVRFLEEPWFVSGMESLKAMALLESPVSFRRNNIFVLENFLQRV